MTNETNYQPGKLDLAKFSDKELEGLVPLIEKELVKRREMRQKEALEKMRTIAESVGMTPEELLGLELPRRRRTTKRTPTSGLQHPDDPSKVYRGGRKPAWLKALNEEGREPIKVT
jgi:DNA-binding protein H-NS